MRLAMRLCASFLCRLNRLNKPSGQASLVRCIFADFGAVWWRMRKSAAIVNRRALPSASRELAKQGLTSLNTLAIHESCQHNVIVRTAALVAAVHVFSMPAQPALLHSLHW